ncbi:MAG TPA: galactitol-1-phosphate 5-dehydrogenase [Phototrophicaceae bacterium]|nr:galactitol-1-phosphate 5-dehydrogenase [Phototrophicaceae bacterium]
MQALVFHGTRQISLEDYPVPAPQPGEVLVKVAACGICGSDLHGYLGHSKRRSNHIPLIMGHEFTGRIVALGEGIGGWTAGDRVVVQPQMSCGHCRACRAGKTNICPNMAILGIERHGAFAEYVSVPADRLFRIPDALDDSTASLTETLAVEVHLFRQYGTLYPRTVAVLGAGAQGLLAIQLARNAGAEQIIASDLFADRLELAQAAGATVTVRADQQNPVEKVLQLTEGWGADLVVDAVGMPITRQQGVGMLAPDGTLALVGLGEGETTLNFLPVVNKELHIHGSYCYSDDDFALALELLASGRVKPHGMVRDVPLYEGGEYFRRLVDAPAGLSKVVLIPPS